MTKTNDTDKDMIWVLLDAPAGGDLSHYAGPLQISVDKLAEHLQAFTAAISKSLGKCKSLAGEFELSEVSIEAQLSAETGFTLVSKAGVEGTIGFKFSKRDKKS